MSETLVAQAPTIRDSAGVRIISNAARAGAPVVFRLGARPILQVGGPEENTDNEFEANQGYLRGTWLSGGGLTVIDVVRVHSFDSRGTRLRISGRSGAGPEEFLYLTSICRTRGDTVVVSDARNGRLGILDRDGRIVRTTRVAEIGSPPFDGCFDDGTVLLQRLLPTGAGSSGVLRLTRIGLDGSVVDEVGEFRVPSFDMVTQSEPSIIAAGQRLYIADGLRSEVRVYSARGELTTIVRSADRLEPITAAEAEERMRRTIPRNTPPDQVAQRMERMRSQPRAATWPAYRRVHVDPRGWLWVQDYVRQYPAPDGWSAFDATGRLIGRLIIPAPPAGERRVEVIAFGTDQVMVRRQDGDGFPVLSVFPIERVRR